MALKLNDDVIRFIHKSGLCWLATVDSDGQPNVTPKQIFTHVHQEAVVIADIASPNSVSNCLLHPQVAVSFVDIFLQKGYQVKGLAEVIRQTDQAFDSNAQELISMLKGKFEIRTIIKVTPTKIRKIWAPSYQFYPETTETAMKEDARIFYDSLYQRDH